MKDGWPLGLGALNLRAEGIRRADLSSSLSLSTVFTSSHCESPLTSSGYDTELSGSFQHGGGMTLASLVGIVDVLDLSARLVAQSPHHRSSKASNSGKLKALLFSLCLRTHLETGNGAAPSLGQFLELERRASHVHRMSQGSSRLLNQ